MSDVLKRRLRCAVYTRKSTDEGLDQEYNSIDAQRDAGHAYIAVTGAYAASLLSRAGCANLSAGDWRRSAASTAVG